MRPNAGLLLTGGTGEIKITLQPGTTDDKHKFMVQTLVVPNNYSELDKDEQAALWKGENGKGDNKNMMSSKLLCEFKLDNIPETLPEGVSTGAGVYGAGYALVRPFLYFDPPTFLRPKPSCDFFSPQLYFNQNCTLTCTCNKKTRFRQISK